VPSTARRCRANWACPWWRPWACERAARDPLRTLLDAPARRAWPPPAWPAPERRRGARTHARCAPILQRLGLREPGAAHAALRDRIDRVVLHPVWGLLLLAAVLFLMFQAVFSWAERPWTGSRPAWGWASWWRAARGLLRSLLVDGIIAGVGGVLVFLPQILILFFFILALEDSGYLPRAAFLLDRVMGRWGCRGARSFRCCRALPAPSRASWPRAPSATRATGW
jgi:ferrous iron transport protein B